MATNNYFGFPHGATQYGTTAPGTAYPTTQTGYAVAPAPTPAAPSYGTARPTGYDQAYQPAATPGTYATTATAATYDYGYGRTTQTYDTSKTYYQQAAGATAGYSTPTGYDAGGTAPKVIAGFQPGQATAYAPQPARGTLPPAKAGQQYQQTTQHQPAAAPQPQAYVPTQPTGYSQTVTTVHTTPKSAAVAGTVVPNNSATYPGYDAALYGATTMYVTQQQQQPPPNTKAPANVPGGGGAMPGAPGGAAVITSGPVPAGGSWPNYKSGKGGMQGHGHGHGGGPYKARKPAPKPMLIHYCDVCKISCAGPQTYREHLEGQKHKKRELLLKQAAEPGGTAPARPPNSLHCELCGVTCTGNDAYAAHVRGAKHQKVVKLHTKLGKPIPACDPTPNADGEKKESAAGESSDAAGGAAAGANNAGGGGGVGGGGAESSEESVRPVGSEFIEEIKDDDGKLVSFSCKLCECKFNDPNAKEMHMKGRRHRLQYKKKVQPDLVVDIKPTVKQKKIAEARAHRQAMQEEFWNRRRMADAEMEEEHGMRTFGRHPFFGMLPGRRPESSDDRHVVARHAEIYPKEEELQTIQRIVSHTERALKLVSDVMTSGGGGATASVPATQPASAATAPAAAGAPSEQKTEPTNDQSKEQEIQSQQPSTTAGNGNGKANQMISFHKETEGTTIRLLKGVMRVGLLAKGLLLHGDNCVQLVVLCAEKPTTSLLKRVATELPIQLKKIAEDHRYTVTMAPVEGAVLVTDGTITVKISLTSPLLREANAPSAEQAAQNTEDLLPREPCLQALAALRHAKWFQARATGLQSCVMIMRIMRDLCQRIPIWSHISQWAMELLLEKIISSAGEVLTPGECLRRVMEAISSAILINGPGLLDPCEKEPEDTLAGLSKQQREDITVSAQMFLRCIAFRQIYKVLGIEPLPPPKFAGSRNWRFNRKRRRSGTEGNDSEADGSKMLKKDESGASSASSGAVSATGTNNATAGKMETSQ